MLMSLASIESSQMEEPPAYTTAVQYPVSMCIVYCVCACMRACVGTCVGTCVCEVYM